MKLQQIVFGALAISSVVTACKDVDFKKSKGGVPYKIISAGKSKDSISVGNIIKYQTILKVESGKKDTVLRNTYLTMPAMEEVGPATDSYGDPRMEIIRQSHKGDSIYFVQAMDSFIARNPEILQSTPFKKGDRLVTTMKIIDVYTSPDQAQAAYVAMMKEYEKTEQRTIENYLSKNKIQANRTEKGVYIQTLTPGSGPAPDSGKYVTVNYRGTNLEGKEFDKGTFPMQMGTGRSVPGFEEAIKNMHQGEKARAFIPSMLAYGQQGSQGRIKPFEILIFEMELVSITTTPPAAMAPPQQINPNPDGQR